MAKGGSAMQSDSIILVDMYDRPVGSTDKLSVHKQGLLHRAFSIFIVDNGRMLIQKRHPAKYHSGGLWSNACCSHPRVGEDVLTAASRRLKEELGISCPLEPLGSLVYRSCFENGITEFEYDHVILGEYRGPLSPNPEELTDIKWVDLDDLAVSVQRNPEIYTSWFVIAVHQVLEYLKGNH